MKKLFILCLMATTILAFDSCKKDPVIIDDNQKPIASFSYTTSQITGGLAIKCTNYSSYATSYEWHIWNDASFEEFSYETNPTFNVYSVGTYYISLSAENEYGSDYTYKSVKVTAKPTGYQFTSLKLTKIPMQDSNNASWDTGLFGAGDPDIFFKIMSEDHLTTYVTGETVDDVSQSDLPISWTITNCPTLSVGTKYIVRFSDEDGVDLNDVMSNCIWEVKASQEGQTSFNWNAQNGSVSFTAQIKWIYPSKDAEEFICIEDGETAGEAISGQLDMNGVK